MGGGAMRTAAKAVSLGGYRSVGQASAASARKTPRPTTTSIHAAAPAEESGRSIAVLSSDNARTDAPTAAVAQWPSWDIDDWEFTSGKEELFDSVHPSPRLVFGPAPTLEEAKEATMDLKDALEKVQFSSCSTEDTVMVSKVSNPSGCATTLPAAPSRVVQAFSLLQEIPEAQNVVASLAADEKVWDAVLKNEKVIEFFRNQNPILSPETNVATEESVAENGYPNISYESVESPKKESTSEKGSGFTELLEKVKVKASEMVSNISGFLQDFMGTWTESRRSTSTSTRMDSAEDNTKIFTGSFLALAIAVILLVLFKRG